MSRYDPDLHDLAIIKLWKEGLDDYEIHHELSRKGIDFSFITVQQARQGLKLKSNRRPECVIKSDKGGVIPKMKENPLAVAKNWLGSRLTEKEGCYRLDGVPANLVRIMQSTNGLLAKAGADLGQPELASEDVIGELQAYASLPDLSERHLRLAQNQLAAARDRLERICDVVEARNPENWTCFQRATERVREAEAVLIAALLA